MICLSLAASCLALAGGTPVAAAPKPVASFSALRAVPAETARPRVEAWLRSQNAYDEAAFTKAWPAGMPPSEGLIPAVTLALPEVASLTEPSLPGDLPAVLKSDKLDPFVRSQLAATAARSAAYRKAFEESLAAAKLATPELTLDPAGYYFYRAVAEHATMQRESAGRSLSRLLEDVADVPDRYRVVATLLFFDVENWPKDEKDLNNIGRLMDNSARRLELARGGKVTQAIQEKIVFRLDELIKQKENQAKQQAQGKPGDGQCPAGKPGDGPGQGRAQGPPSGPQPDSFGGRDAGDGKVDAKKLKNYELIWGKLPEAERAKITQDFVRDMPPKFRPMIEDYFRSLNKINGFKP